MFDRVVAALIAVMLVLFSASAALACVGCDSGAAQCLVSLELQAEEVVSTDLEVFASIDVESYVENAIVMNDQAITANTDRYDTTESSGASGVQQGTTPTAHDSESTTIRSGRFTGAPA